MNKCVDLKVGTCANFTFSAAENVSSKAPPTMSISICMLNFKGLYLRNSMGLVDNLFCLKGLG